MGMTSAEADAVPSRHSPLPSGLSFTRAVTSSVSRSPTTQVSSPARLTVMYMVALSPGSRSRKLSKLTVRSPLAGSALTLEGGKASPDSLQDTKVTLPSGPMRSEEKTSLRERL